MGKPKYIGGLTGNNDGNFWIGLSYSLEDGYDKVTRVEDISEDSYGVGTVTNKYYKDRIYIFYKDFDNSIDSRKLKIYFESGDVEQISVFVPTSNKKVDNAGDEYSSSKLFNSSEFLDYRLEVTYGTGKSMAGNYAMLPISDPYGKFSYDKAWSHSEPGSLVTFNGSILNTLDPDVTHMGKPFVGPLPQFVMFAAVLDDSKDYLEAGDVWGEVFDANSTVPTITSFIWTKDIPEKPTTVKKTFEVCADPTSPSYYKTTKQDTSGATIDDKYLKGLIPALFTSGACATDTSGFEVVVDVTDPYRDEDGTITVTVLGTNTTPVQSEWEKQSLYLQDKAPTTTLLGTQFFTWELKVPGGIQAPSTTITNGKAAAPVTFTGIKTANAPYTVEVTETATGGKITIPVNIQETSTNSKTKTDRGGDIYFCHKPTAINYIGYPNPTGNDQDPGQICIECLDKDADGVYEYTIGDVPSSQPILVNAGSNFVNETSEGAGDGSIIFNANYNSALAPNLGQFFTNGFDVNLYTTTGVSGPSNTFIYGTTGASSPSYTFNNLADGWYVVEASPAGWNCPTKFYFQIGYGESPQECVTSANFSIDPCSGQTSISVETAYDSLPESGLGINYGVYTEVISPTGESVLFPVSDPIVNIGDTFIIHINFWSNNPLNCNNSEVTHIVTEADRNCSILEGYPIGCMDPTAINFDPSAVISSGQCVYETVGCTDVSALNYDSSASVSCENCCYYCEDQLITGVTVASNIPTLTWFGTAPAVYDVSWESTSTGTVIETENTLTGPYLVDGAYTVTITDANGCIQTYAFGINTTLIYGCMDPNAENFNPAVNVPYGTLGEPGDTFSTNCTYRLEPSPCVPTSLGTIQSNLDVCFSDKSNKYLTLLKSGRLTPCNEAVIRRLSLIKYLLSQRDLECVYNCSDSLSPALSETSRGTSCTSKWSEGGPSGESLIWSATAGYQWGDVVKHPVSDNIYTMILGIYAIGSDPETIIGDPYWEYCRSVDAPSDNTNRLDKYMAYINENCKDCNLKDVTSTDSEPVSTSDSPTTIDGEIIEIEGGGIDLP
jgi:hypothetical protein